MDFTHRRAFEGPAQTVSAIPDLPQAVPAMSPIRQLQAHCPRSGIGSVRTRRDRYPGGVHRGNLRAGKKRGFAVDRTKRAKGTKIMAISDAGGVPVAAHIESASPHEVNLVESAIVSRYISKSPKRMIGDKAYDRDPLDQRIRQRGHSQRYGIELFAPRKADRRKPETQDGQVLRRYRRRWKEERLFSWLYNFRKLSTRWGYHAENFLCMLQLGCVVILLRYF